MDVDELLPKAQFLVDAGGNKTAVMLDYSDWKELITSLEDIEDAEELSRSIDSEEEVVPWEAAKAELIAKGIVM